MKQVTLLLVDDEPPFLDAIRDYLSEYTEFYIDCAL